MRPSSTWEMDNKLHKTPGNISTEDVVPLKRDR